MINNLDITLLHTATTHILEGTLSEYNHKQMGITTAYLYLMLGEVWVGNENATHIYVANNYENSKHAMIRFIHLLNEDNTSFVVTGDFDNMVVTTDQQTFKFTTRTNLLDAIGTIGANVEKVFLDQDISATSHLADIEHLQLVADKFGIILV